MLKGKSPGSLGWLRPGQDMPQEGPVHAQGEVQLFSGHIRKFRTDTLQDSLPVLASFRMKAEFPRNKRNVFDGVVEMAHRIRRDAPRPSCRCRQLRHSIDVKPLHVQ